MIDFDNEDLGLSKVRRQRAQLRMIEFSQIDSRNKIPTISRSKGLPSASNLQSENEYCDATGRASQMPIGGNQRWRRYNVAGAFFLMIFMLFCTTCQADSEMCVHRIGEDLPECPRENEVTGEHGMGLIMCCSLDWSLTKSQSYAKLVSNLEILVNNKRVAADRLTNCDDRSIALATRNLTPLKFMFTCRLRSHEAGRKQYEVLDHKQVVIGSKPTEPRNFTCTSYNLEKLVCTWEPVHNYVPTQFSLEFKPSGIPSSSPSYRCPVPKTEHEQSPNSCQWDVSTVPSYSPNHEYYTFTLIGKNALGSNSFTYEYHNWAKVIPSNPENLFVLNITSSSALLRWSVPIPMQNFPPGLHYRVSYQNPQDSGRNLIIIDVTEKNKDNEIYFHLTGLENVTTPYNVKVFMKSSLADGEEMWGPPSGVTFETATKMLVLPRKSDIGNFEITGNSGKRDVYIYWQTIPQNSENQYNCTYRVMSVEENGRKVAVQPHTITKTYAMFGRIGFNDFKFEILATCKGVGSQKTTVHIPSQIEVPGNAVVHRSIAFDGGTYELSWNRPSSSDVTNYTIFWCENDRDQPHRCSGKLNWVHVPGNVNIHNVTVSDPTKVYRFAIAANTPEASSGVVWFPDIPTPGNVAGTVTSVSLNRTEPDQIEVSWKLDYSGRMGTVEGFNIYYCPIISLNNCKGPKMIATVRGDQSTKYVLEDLKPSTAYVATVAILSKTGEGPYSDPLYFTTPEAEVDPNLTWTAPVTDLRSAIDERFSNMTNVIEELLKQHSDEIDELEYQVSNQTSTVTALMDKFDSLTKENGELREELNKCYNEESTIISQ